MTDPTAAAAHRVGRLVIARARVKGGAYAVFVVGPRVCIVRAQGRRYDRALHRFPAALVGVYDVTAAAETIADDVREHAQASTRVGVIAA